jgi:hypothetical protein
MYWAPHVKAYRTQGEEREGVIGKPGLYVVVYINGWHRVDVLEDTLMSDKEARERMGRQRESNRASAASTARNPPLGGKAYGVYVESYIARKRRARPLGVT